MWAASGHLMAGRDEYHPIRCTSAFRGDKRLSIEILPCCISTFPVLKSRVWSRTSKKAKLYERCLHFFYSFEDTSTLMNGWLCYLAQCKPINRANLVSTVDAYLKAHRLTVVIIDQAMWPRTGLTGLTGQSPDSDKADRQESWGRGDIMCAETS